MTIITAFLAGGFTPSIWRTAMICDTFIIIATIMALRWPWRSW